MRLYGLFGRALLLLGMTACSHTASALDEDFDAHLYVVENFLGNAFNLRNIDADGNGIKDEDQLGLLSVVLEGGSVASGLNSTMVNQITAGFSANLPKVKTELTVDIGDQGTKDLINELNGIDPVLGNAMQKLIAGYITMGDTVTIAFINAIADQVIVQFLDGTPEEDSIPNVQGQINFVASNFSVFGNAGSNNFIGSQGDVDADTLTNLTEYSTAGGDRELWLQACNVANPPLRMKDLNGGGLAISGIPMDFTLETAGGVAAASYEWRKGTPSSSTVLSSTNTFSIPFLNASDSGKYFCTYTDGVRTRNTPVLQLTVTRVNIFISQNILGGTRNLGSSITFTVGAQGGSPGPYTYTWKKGGAAIGGAPNAKTYTINNLQVADAGSYSVTVSSNGGGDGVTSGPVTLNVNSNIPPIAITQQPASAARAEGAAHTFSIGVSGGSGNYNYDWRKGGISLGAPNQNTLVIASVTAETIGIYSCFVTDQADAGRNATSQNATLSITANPVNITTQPEDQTAALGESAFFSVAASGGGGVFIYDWRKNGVSLGAVNLPTYNIAGVQSTDAGEYTCVVTDASEQVNSQESEAATLTVLPVFNLSIIDQPDNVTRSLGQSATFSVTVIGGTGFYTYTWKKNGDALGAQSANQLTVSNISVADAGEYTVEVRDSFQPSLGVTSNAATLNLNLATLVITQQPQGATKALGQSHTFSVAATGGSGQYSYAWFKDSESIGITSASFTLNSLDGDDTGIYACVVTDTGLANNVASDPAVLQVLEAPPIVISQQPQGAFRYSGDQHTLSVTVSGGTGSYHFDWLKDGVSLCGEEDACDTNQLTFGALATTDAGNYSVVITDASFPALSATSITVPLGVQQHVTIVKGPRGRTVYSGEVVELEVEVVGGFAPVSYEWLLDGDPIPDAIDAPIYQINPALLEKAGEYTCVITDGFADTQVTQAARLNVELADLPDDSAETGTVNMSGALTVPPSGSASEAQGSATLTNLGTKGAGGFSLALLLSQSIGQSRGPVLTLNSGAPGSNGPVLFTIPFVPSVNFINQTLTLTDEQASIIYSGRGYLTIATTEFPNGELRAPLFPLIELIVRHDADINGDFEFNLTELLRVIQLFNLDAYHCDDNSEDGYAPGLNVDLENCQPHSADYNPADEEWVISLSEVLRLIQIFNTGNRQYHECDSSEDGFCPGPAPEGEGEGAVEGE